MENGSIEKPIGFPLIHFFSEYDGFSDTESTDIQFHFDSYDVKYFKYLEDFNYVYLEYHEIKTFELRRLRHIRFSDPKIILCTGCASTVQIYYLPSISTV